MDVKSDSFHAQVKVFGVGESPKFSGSVLSLMNQIARWLNGQAVRKDSQGKRTINITIQDVEFGTEHPSGLPQEFLDHLDMTGIRQESDMTPEELAEFYNVPIWTQSENWKRFQGYMSTRSNYERALPGEIHELQRLLMEEFKDARWTDNNGIIHIFGEHLIVNKRA